MGEVFLTAKGVAAAMFEKAGIDGKMEFKLAHLGYFDAPASKGHHLAKRGGLLTHSLNVTKRLVRLGESLGVNWPRTESPYLIGMLHDLVKCRCYQMVDTNCPDKGYKYVQPAYAGHGVCSIAIAVELGIDLLPAEVVAIMYHMGAFGIGKEYTDKEFYAAMSNYAPYIIATHAADWYAASVDEIDTNPVNPVNPV